MSDADNLRKLIKRHEGLRLTSYKDTTGNWTVGYGHNLDASHEPIPVSITIEEAEQYFEKDLDEAIRGCETCIPWFRQLDHVRQAILIDMCFNMGAGSVESGHGLMSFVNTLPLIKAGQYAQAASNMLLSEWADQVGSRATEDAHMMLVGEWPAWIGAQPEPAEIPKPKAESDNLISSVIRWISGLFNPRQT